MRPLEIFLPSAIALYLIWPYPRPFAIRLVPTLAVILTLIHFAIEGYRWQMVPIYILALLFAIIAMVSINKVWDMKITASLSSLILLAVSTALPILLPVPSIPAPGGPYEVGTTTYELKDDSRRELYSGRDEARRFQIQVWYPSEAGPSEKHAPWMNHADIFGRALSDFLSMPHFFLDHLALVRTPAYQDSPIAKSDEKFPIIIFSHGWKGFAGQNSGQAIDLASHGYVVVALQHTYGSIVTVFSDGTIAANNPNALPDGKPEAEYDLAARKLVDQWAGDISYALGFMTEQNNDPKGKFYASLDLSRIGVYGHSTGGGAAIQFCGTDERCKALLAMDPFMTPVSLEVLNNGLQQPSFIMFGQAWYDEIGSKNNRLFDDFYSHVSQSKGVIGIDGTKHYDFSDLPLLSPLTPQLGLKGPIDGKRVTVIVDDYLLSFFDMTLKNIGSNLFGGRSEKYPEVKLLK